MWNQPQLFVSKTMAQVIPELFAPIENDRYGFLNKPRGGIWTAPYDAARETSSWVEYMQENELNTLRLARFWLLTPDPQARVYTVESQEHLHFLTQTYPLKKCYDPHVKKIDFEAAARAGLDGIAVTWKGIYATEYSEPEGLWGWDVASVLWLRWRFIEVQELINFKKVKPRNN